MNKMTRHRMRFIFFPFIAVAILFLVGFLVMQLWNYTLPALFGISTINLWQAMALFFLCKILFGFGGAGPRRGGPPWRGKAGWRKFERMSEADKERLGAYMRYRSCHWDDQAETSTDTSINTNKQSE